MKDSPGQPRLRRYVPAVGPRLRILLFALFALFALISVNSLYLLTIRIAEAASGQVFQDYFYQYMFLAHLGLGLLLIVPVIVYGIQHVRNAHDRPNRRAVKVGYALLACALVLLASGLALTRGLPLLELRAPAARQAAYWLHVAGWLAVVWLFVLHRLAGKRINWRVGGAILAGGALFAAVMLAAQMQDPRQWGRTGPAEGEQYFQPSLARTASGDFIPARDLMNDTYCGECHADTHEQWAHSMHRFASFNNPVYRFSVRNTRQFSMARDGNVQRSRFCAGCHDPVPFFSGAFDDPDFDDVNHPTATAGITCSACHAITHINSPRGNADYTVEAPLHYPFTYSENRFLKWLNRMLVKAKPGFHKKTFLKPLHRSTEFCGSCHKVHLPEALNDYKWLRGQNHYDSFLLSGVSGHGVTSFYYPDRAEKNCNGCHMPRMVSDDFGAAPDEHGELTIHDHQFASANTAIPHMLGMPDWVNANHRKMLEDSVRVDIFGLRRGHDIGGELLGPDSVESATLEPGGRYLVEIVIRTLTLGHPLTQGTADSNELWVELVARAGGEVIGHSGAADAGDGSVDPRAHRINVYMLDRDGNRIDGRNAEDIFTPLYNHQIPPGAAATLHYALTLPESMPEDMPLTLTARVNYRKFDTVMMRQVQGDAFVRNDLPVTVLGEAQAVVGGVASARNPSTEAPLWMRWNDYGIGLLRAGQLRQAEAAFEQVAGMGRGLGFLNLARTRLEDGRLEAAAAALAQAGGGEHPAYPWAVAYWTGELNRQNGFVEDAIAIWTDLEQTRYQEARTRGFDFSRDYRLLDQLGQAWLERARLASPGSTRDDALAQARSWFERALAIDPERAESHYGLAQVLRMRGERASADEHAELHRKYRIDDNARDRAIAIARARDPAADHAADDIVIYPLNPPKIDRGTP
ncbi:MAG: hypothetical protein CMP07_00120 [Xanthomonadales bacterium]|nr:hypothetical protein [Xanthomonadales bacterium]